MKKVPNLTAADTRAPARPRKSKRRAFAPAFEQYVCPKTGFVKARIRSARPDSDPDD